MSWNISPSHEEVVLLMEAGMIYRDSMKIEEAREVFRGVRAMLPRSDTVEVALGTVSFQEGDFETAAQHYRRALELNQRSAYAYAHLGEVALFQRDAETAGKQLRRAIELDPRGEVGKFARGLLEFAATAKFKNPE